MVYSLLWVVQDFVHQPYPYQAPVGSDLGFVKQNYISSRALARKGPRV